MLLQDAFLNAVHRLPQKVAIVNGEQRLTYAQLYLDVLAVARALRDDGVMPGDRVVILLENSLEYVVALHAVLIAGGVSVPVSAMTKADKLAFILNDTKARALMTHAHLAAAWAPALARSVSVATCRVIGEVSDPVGDTRIKMWQIDEPSAAPMDACRID